MNKLLEQVLEAHGGLERWKQYKAIEIDLVTGGELLEKKVGRVGDVLRTTVSIHEQATMTVPADGSNKRAVFTPGRVAIETIDGQTIAERLNPSSFYHNHNFDTTWDAFHRIYFAGYTLWSYLTVPFSFAVDGAQIWDIDPLEENGEIWQGIRVVMPSNYATHSRAQDFYFGADMLLRRQDYTIDIAGGDKVANYALDIVDVEGFKLPSKRRVYLCNKKYDVLWDRLGIILDMSNFRIIA